MTELEFLEDALAKRYGTVKRARGTFLYTAKGVRLTDLYAEGGRAVLGWGGGSAFTMFKNVLSRGITGSYKTDFDGRLRKAVCDLLNDKRDVFLFPTFSLAYSNALSLSKENTKIWQPWGQDNTDVSRADCVVIEPPLPWLSDVTLLAVKPGLEVFGRIPDTVKLPAPLTVAMSRSIYDMIAALQNRREEDWYIYDPVLTKYWTRKGPWLYPKVPKDMYEKFILHCLDCNLVISPVYDKPSVVPYKADRGVFGRLKNKPFDF